MKIEVRYPDFSKQSFYPAAVRVKDGRIASVEPLDAGKIAAGSLPIMLPGLVDAHVHIESSMLVPSVFAARAVQQGTVATVSDPHEIANVLGTAGVDFMLQDAGQVPLKFHFTAPSCVPATDFESSGATIDSVQVGKLLDRPGVIALGEMMNFPGVVFRDPEVLAKIKAAVDRGLVVDGHAPGLSGADLVTYVRSGISTDHEAVSIEEARDKIALGMKILIREGSAARNFDALHPLITESTEQVMLCTDDIHPDDLMQGHIDTLIRKGLASGHSIFDLIQVACTNPVEHYGLGVGGIAPGQKGDFILVNNLTDFTVLETWINGVPVYQNGQVLFSVKPAESPNTFIDTRLAPEDFVVAGAPGKYHVMEAVDGSLLTRKLEMNLPGASGQVAIDLNNDVLKIAVVNRYKPAKPAVGFVKNFGLKRGAIASSVAHDSHNIIAVGATDAQLALVVNALIQSKGGIVVSDEETLHLLPLPVAGIMSTESCAVVAAQYEELSSRAQVLGSTLRAPFMTLSFMALLVIPELKLGDKGLFDVTSFQFVPLAVDNN